MHNIKDIVARPDFYKERLGLRGVPSEYIDVAVSLEKDRIRKQQEVEELRAEINKNNSEIQKAKKLGGDCSQLLRFAEIYKRLMPLAERGELNQFIEDLKSGTVQEPFVIGEARNR